MAIDDTWTDRDYPVLEACVRGVDAGRVMGGARFYDIAEQTGLDAETVYVSARALEDAGLIENSYVMPGTHSRVVRVAGAAREMVGSWPSADGMADRMLDAVEAVLQTDLNEIERSKWQAIRDGAMSAGRDVMVQLAAMAMSGRLPH